MSDFSTFNDFRKGYKLGGKNEYSDPTYLSFSIIFDFNSAQKSPLLGGAAAAFYERHLSDAPKDDGTEEGSSRVYHKGYEHRLKALNDFNLTLAKINNEMPWYWQSLSGLEVIQQYNVEEGYWGGDIKIETIESLNLTIAGLMHLYRTAVFDEVNWKYILPVNLRKFRAWVYVTEVRPIKNMTKVGANISVTNGELNGGIGVENSNAGISGTGNRPFFMFELGECMLDIKSGVNPFADLKKSPEGFAVNEIAFHYDTVGKIEARMLNGIIEESAKTAGNISPAGEKESRTADSLGEYGKQVLTDFGNNAIDRLEGDANLFLQKKEQELSQGLSNVIRDTVPNFENIYQNFVNDLDEKTDLTDIASNIKDNVFGSAGKTAKQALDDAALAGLGTNNTPNDLGSAYE